MAWRKLHENVRFDPLLRSQPVDVRDLLTDLTLLCDDDGRLTRARSPDEIGAAVGMTSTRAAEVIEILIRLNHLARIAGYIVVVSVRADHVFAASRRPGAKAKNDKDLRRDARMMRSNAGASPSRAGARASDSGTPESGLFSLPERSSLHETSPEQKPPAAGRPRRAPSGPVQEIIAWWQSTYPAEVPDDEGCGIEYEMARGDAEGVARYVARHRDRLDLELVKRVGLVLMRTTQPFWCTNRNLRTLFSRFSDIRSLPLEERSRRDARPQGVNEGLEAILSAQYRERREEIANGISGHARRDQRGVGGSARGVPALQARGGDGGGVPPAPAPVLGRAGEARGEPDRGRRQAFPDDRRAGRGVQAAGELFADGGGLLGPPPNA